MMLKVGLIGLGAITRVHREAISRIDGVEVVAGCDTNPERVKAFVDETGGAGFDDYRPMLGMDVDIVAVASPHGFHAEMAIAAMEAGCEIVLEKPAAVTMDQCRAIGDCCDCTGGRVIVSDSVYHQADILAARRVVASGELGRFISGMLVNFRRYFTPGRPKWFLDRELSGGGQLINIGVHRIATFRAVLAKEEVCVKASVGCFEPGVDVEGNGSIFIGYEDGSAMMLEENGYYDIREGLQRGCHFNFERGVLSLGETVQIFDREGRCEKVSESRDSIDAYEGVYQELIAAIGEDRQPYPSIAHGVRDVRVILAAYESARTGREVRLDDPRWALPAICEA